MISATKENYLKALYTLSNEKGEVYVNDLSKRLKIKMPTVNSMVKKLAEKELVIYETYRPLRLTAKGKQEAIEILRKHRLTELFLVEIMGFGWEQVHEIAEQVEHIQSDEFFEKMDKILGYPKLDPHGSPIPDKDGNIELINAKKLSDCSKDEVITLVSLIDTGDDFLKFLNSKNITLNSEFKILSVSPVDNSVEIEINQKNTLTLSHTIAERLYVR